MHRTVAETNARTPEPTRRPLATPRDLLSKLAGRTTSFIRDDSIRDDAAHSYVVNARLA
jgi:hypothetical protein